MLLNIRCEHFLYSRAVVVATDSELGGAYSASCRKYKVKFWSCGFLVAQFLDFTILPSAVLYCPETLTQN